MRLVISLLQRRIEMGAGLASGAKDKTSGMGDSLRTVLLLGRRALVSRDPHR